jgi:hypothetical protein
MCSLTLANTLSIIISRLIYCLTHFFASPMLVKYYAKEILILIQSGKTVAKPLQSYSLHE